MTQYLNRKKLRLPDYDYNAPGAYFITICTQDRKPLFSRITEDRSELTDYGRMVDAVLTHLPDHLKVTLDQYVIMPNHLHLLLVITEEEGLRHLRSDHNRCRSILSNAVGYIKMNISKQIHDHSGLIRVWQRGYHDHIIRNQQDYDKIATYIGQNVLRWQLDCFYTP
ncbi:MAG: transposase [Clostridia bacterium]|nr:transposase [Clostridia bacterium]